FIEFYLVITPNHHKVVQWYRIILTGFIPAYIIYKVKFLGIDLYSADILVFVILPVCQIGMAVVNALSDEYDDFNDISFLDNR
ncbi:MAG: hypothetical protein PHC75_10510, partial [Burkholderiales bacterium]|nr:hypothetical protein [Burkholderiales bacterium]